MQKGLEWLAGEVIGHLVVTVLLGTGVLIMLAILGLTGKRYQAVLRRFKAVEDRDTPTSVVVNVGPDNSNREILDALESMSRRDEADKAAVYSLQEIKEAAASLPQHRFEGTNHTYAELPAGTNIVTMEDGSIRLAIPKQIAATFTAPSSTASVALSKRPPNGS